MSESCRLDKWLWAARFFKTRALASEAVSGGKVHLNGARVKPSRTVSIGDELSIRRGDDLYEVVVRGINKQRRPASEATRLYEESEESVEKRQAAIALRRVAGAGRDRPTGKPDKHQRRKIVRFKREN